MFREKADEAGAVLDALVDARLLTEYESPEGHPGRRIEIADESLLTHWPQLARWRAGRGRGAAAGPAQAGRAPVGGARKAGRPSLDRDVVPAWVTADAIAWEALGGGRIAFGRPQGPHGQRGFYGVCVGDTARATLSCHAAAYENAPDHSAISPDGSMIAVHGPGGTFSMGGGVGVFRLPDWAGIGPLLLDDGAHPAWHPNGQTVFYLSPERPGVWRYALTSTTRRSEGSWTQGQSTGFDPGPEPPDPPFGNTPFSVSAENKVAFSGAEYDAAAHEPFTGNAVGRGEKERAPRASHLRVRLRCLRELVAIAPLRFVLTDRDQLPNLCSL